MKRRCCSVTGSPHIEPTTGNGDTTGCDGLKVSVTRNSNYRRCSWTDGCNINMNDSFFLHSVSKTSPMFFAITRESIVGFHNKWQKYY